MFKFLLSTVLFSTISAAPLTHKQLEINPLAEIKHYLEVRPEFEKNLPLLMHIIEGEDAPGFFGYHGHSQKFRIFQDILKAAVEESLDFKCPADSYFLRVPGEEQFDLAEGTKSFYDMFDPVDASLAIRQKLGQRLILDPINEKSGAKLNAKDLSLKELSLIFEPIASLSDALKQPFGDSFEQFFKPYKGLSNKPSLEEQIIAALPKGPGYEYKKKALMKMALVKSSKKPVPKTLLAVIKKYAKGENFEALVAHITDQKKIAERFFELYYAEPDDELASYFFPYWDTRPLQQSRVVSLNCSLFGNYNVYGESTIMVFLNDRSIENGEDRIIELLRKFFFNIGLKPELANDLIVMSVENIRGHKEGCILQFFSHDPDFLNSQTYASLPFGIPVKIIEPADLQSGKRPFISPDGTALQMRLLTTNSGTLNPYSPLKMVRYDTLDPLISQKIMDDLRIKLREAPQDPIKKDLYRQKLIKLWNL